MLPREKASRYGPPPRVWGEHQRSPLVALRCPVHPHACGENCWHRLGLCLYPRSTPTRVGRTSPPCRRGIVRRSTPTRVGRTSIALPGCSGNAVHPHACGENSARHDGGSGRRRSTPTRVGRTTEDVTRGEMVDGPPPRVWGEPRPQRPRRGPVSVHPHACGENGCETGLEAIWYGPPPRVWGERGLASCAGYLALVHPHACGENALSITEDAPSAGPPPRVWGERSLPPSQSAPSRSTPTRVGRTLSTPSALWTCSGPPPRVWGERQIACDNRVGVRSTPTRVGRTLCSARDLRYDMVHPHACGENILHSCDRAVSPGPPPRVWGEHVVPRLLRVLERSTPTRVGRTTREPSHRRSRAVHPHACGENTRSHRRHPQPDRSTPTRVGKTLYSGRSGIRGPVHPHACGENCSFPVQVLPAHGPPPRVWGKPLRPDHGPDAVGSTPTRVGKTPTERSHRWKSTVHPHACGENIQELVFWQKSRWSTPTRVGKTHQPRAVPFYGAVHPHACGENVVLCLDCWF